MPLVIPANPLPTDSIRIVAAVAVSHRAALYNAQLTRVGNSINIEFCLSDGGLTQPTHYHDTFNIGTLPLGNYTITSIAYTAFDSLCENRMDSSTTNISVLRVGNANSLSKIMLGDGYKLNLKPNPTRQKQTLNITTTKPEQLNIRLTDLSGRVVLNVIDEKVEAGERSIPIDVSNLAPGLYFYRVRFGEREQVMKMVKN